MPDAFALSLAVPDGDPAHCSAAAVNVEYPQHHVH